MHLLLATHDQRVPYFFATALFTSRIDLPVRSKAEKIIAESKLHGNNDP